MFQLTSKTNTADERQAEDIMCHSGYCHDVDLLGPWLVNYMVFKEHITTAI